MIVNTLRTCFWHVLKDTSLQWCMCHVSWGRGEKHQGSQDPGAPINHSLWELVQRVGLYLRICLFKQNPLNCCRGRTEDLGVFKRSSSMADCGTWPVAVCMETDSFCHWLFTLSMFRIWVFFDLLFSISALLYQENTFPSATLLVFLLLPNWDTQILDKPWPCMVQRYPLQTCKYGYWHME